MRSRRVVKCWCALALASITSLPAQTQGVEQKLTAAVADDGFGSAMAISGDTLVVGAWRSSLYRGAAYVFVRTAGVWTEQAMLTAADGAEGDAFGGAVAISGDTIVIGAPGADVGTNADQGTAYVFVRSGAVWTHQATLTAHDGAAGDSFGKVAVSGDTIVAGAAYDAVGGQPFQGSAYVFGRESGGWIEQAKLTASDGAAFDLFGWDVAVDGETLVVGALSGQDFIEDGSAYIFTRRGSSWIEEAKLTTSEQSVWTDYFGASVAISGDRVVIGAPQPQIGDRQDAGYAYVFVRAGGGWVREAKLAGADGDVGDAFGASVAIRGDRIVIGAFADDVGGNENQGSARLFVRDGATWREHATLTADGGAAHDWFAISVAIGDDTVLAGTFAFQLASVHAFAFDSTPPDTTIVSGPPTLARHATAVFHFDSSEPDSAFECSLDGGPFETCASPVTYEGLPDGGHTFRVRAIDAAGNADVAPAEAVWTIDSTPPETHIVHAADGTARILLAGDATPSRGVTFEFAGSDAAGVAGFSCRLDGADFGPCTSPASYTGLSIGAHTFDVRAHDSAGNADETPASFRWTVETAADALGTLIELVEEIEGDATGGLAPSLKQATGVLNDANANNDRAACGQLDAFVTRVNQKLKRGELTAAEAAQLIDSAAAIKASIGCER